MRNNTESYTEGLITTTNEEYSLFHQFFEKYANSGLESISLNDPLVVELEQSTKKNKQLFYMADAVLLDIQYVSKSVYPMFGVQPEQVNLGYFLTTTHPEDQKRHHLARAKLISTAQELYIQKKGHNLISINVRARKPDGTYFNALYQAFLFYSKIPYESVFLLLVITDITSFNKLHKEFHFYNGNDRSLFRYPDVELLSSGCIFTNTEFKIIELIQDRLSSQEIANKLFRSIHTIKTHRNNILQKSGKSSITDVIFSLKEKGLL